MNGQILDFTIQTSSGVISGEDGNRYDFVASEWKDSVNPSRGMRVDFEVDGNNAVSIYRAAGAAAGADFSNIFSGEKNKMVAGVLGIVLGWLGIHKFYLGITGPAKLQAIGGGVAIVLTWILPSLFGFSMATFFIAAALSTLGYLVWLAMGIVGLIEGILYLTKSDEDFEQIYVVGKKPWF